MDKALPGTVSMGDNKYAPGPNWKQLARLYWHQYVFLACSIMLLGISEKLEPFYHVMYHKSDNEYWKVRTLCKRVL